MISSGQFEFLGLFLLTFRGGIDALRQKLLFQLQDVLYSVDGLESFLLVEICYGEFVQSFFQFFLHFFLTRLLHMRSAGHDYG